MNIVKLSKNIRHTLKNKFVMDFLWNITSFGIVTISVTIINVIIGNYYNADGLGIFNYSFSIYTILATFTVFGIKNSVVKYISEYKDQKKELIKLTLAAIMLVVLISLTLSTLFIIANKIILPTTNTKRFALLYVTMALPVFSLNEVFMGALNGMRRMKEYAVTRTIRWILVLSFILMAIAQNRTVQYSSLAFLYAEILILCVLLLMNRDLLFGIKQLGTNAVDSAWFKKHLSFGFKTTLIRSSNELDTKLPILLIGLFLSNTSIGIFSFATTVTTGLIMIPSVISLNFNPIISNLWYKDKHKLLEHYQTLKKNAVYIILPSFFLAGILYPIFVNIFMKGDIYKQSIPIFYILLIGTCFVSSIFWQSGFFPMIGKPEQQFKIKLISLMVNLILNLVFIPLYGLIGSALATTLAGLTFAVILKTAISKEMKTALTR